MARSVREIDRNDDKYVGIRFPLGYSPEGFFYKTKTVLEQSKANLRNLLLTTPGERIFQPDFGCNLKNLVFEQRENISEDIESTIRTSVDRYLSYINIINVFTIQENNQVNIQVEFSVPLNPEDIEVLNFDFRIGE
jgi:phage baseplate assembly protein W|tara:strand:- start:153 stop:560 length:408 start_codon:yes stop_codon:yes gene_type:complete